MLRYMGAIDDTTVVVTSGNGSPLLSHVSSSCLIKLYFCWHSTLLSAIYILPSYVGCMMKSKGRIWMSSCHSRIHHSTLGLVIKAQGRKKREIGGDG